MMESVIAKMSSIMYDYMLLSHFLTIKRHTTQTNLRLVPFAFSEQSSIQTCSQSDTLYKLWCMYIDALAAFLKNGHSKHVQILLFPHV